MSRTPDYKEHVEKVANQIITIIREHPNITLVELHTLLRKTATYEQTEVSLVRRYMHGLHKLGYISKSFARPHKYSLIKDHPFTYARLRYNHTQ
jgi:hypothetical protein